MFERILVAVDGSEDSRRAATLAVELAARLGSRLAAICVVDVRVVEGPAVETLAPLWGEVTGRPFQPEVLRLYRERADAVLDHCCARAEARGIETVRSVEIGVAEEAILERAAETDLLVLGRRGEHAGFGRQAMGATLWRVLHRSPCPVLVAAPPRPGVAHDDAVHHILPRRPLIAWDPSPGGRKALDLGIGFVQAVGGELRLVHAGGEAADEDLREAQGRVARSGIPWEGARLDLSPAEAVLEATRRWNSDALFMGAFGRGRLRDLLFGSHTAEILAAVPLPVFVASTLN